MGLRWDTRLEEVAPQTPLQLFCCACCSVFWFAFILLVFPLSFVEVSRLNYALAKDSVTGVVDMETVWTEGRYYLGFWTEAILFPSTLRTIEFSEEKPEEEVQHLSVLRSRDMDGKRIYLDVSVQYLLMQDKVGNIYNEMLTFYEDIYISELRDQLSKACNRFAIEDAWLNYTQVIDLMTEACTQALSTYHATCWGLQLWGIRLEPKFEAALIRTQVRKQGQRTEENRKRHTVVRAETEVRLAEFRKNKTIIEADGEAQRYLIQQEALATAEANYMDAQAKSLEIVRNIVKVRNETEMSNDQLIRYQKLLMLQNKTNTNFLVQGTAASFEAAAARSVKQLGQGTLSGSDALLVKEQ
mmetsp:Transcript_70795/g.166122  ORF Transcript_70795/g.166122 Transcript_70795/m.166122 type:complete len:356 (-) Transcript_70795:95-1162(-)